MAEYKPLFVYLEPASIPQVVAHIQKYLAENPIISDEETIAELIREYIAAHPEIIAVASVNGKVGAVVLTGSDIMINPSSAVSVETQLLNLASMINNTGADVSQIQANISQIYTTIGTLQTSVETNASNISALQKSVEGQGTRLATAETDIDNLETAQSSQNTRLNTAEGNISSLQTRMAQAETDIDNNESSIESLNTNVGTLQTDMNNLKNKTLISNAQSEQVAPTLAAGQYVKCSSLTLNPGVYIVRGEATLAEAGTASRDVALRLGFNSTEGPFIYVPTTNAWQHREVTRLVALTSTTEISLYLYSSFASTGKCANSIFAIKIN